MAKDITGKSVGNWIVLSKVRPRVWLCQCVCGEKKQMLSGNLRTTESCGCIKERRGHKRYKREFLDPESSLFNVIYHTYKSNAEKRKLAWKLDHQQANELMIRHCHYCNAKPRPVTRGRSKVVLLLNGIDRVNNKMGYVDGNCVACCTFCNRAKSVMSETEFYEWIMRVYDWYARPLDVMQRAQNAA